MFFLYFQNKNGIYERWDHGAKRWCNEPWRFVPKAGE